MSIAGSGFSMTGDKALISRLKRLSDAVDKDVPKVISEDVLNRGVAVEKGFQAVPYEGTNDVSVSVDQNTDGTTKTWSIAASGTVVLFLEYGTGIFLRHSSEFGNYQAYERKSWSATHGRWLTNPKRMYRYQGWWPLPRENKSDPIHWSQGNASANVMYETKKALEENLPRMIKLALGKANR